MANHTLAILNQIITDGLERGIGHLNTEDATLGGRTMTLNGREVVNFGSCSYLGLERHPALIEGTIDAVRRYGTQFSSSRTYASIGLYAELEDALQQMFGQPVVVSATTTLGHLAALPVLVEDSDAVVLDMQVHASVQMAAQQLKARGVPLHVIRHNDMVALERRIRELKPNHGKIWYLADGIYSMYGDGVPVDDLVAMMARHPQLHLYVDDAHGMSWTGKHGVGHVRSQLPHHPRMVQAVSLNKAFAASGGALIFPTKAMAQSVRNCGATLIFSGPIQPPMLGAAVASARLHLSDEIIEHQARLAHLVAHMNRRLNEAGLPQFMENASPLFFVPAGLPRLDYKIIQRMLEDGFYLNPAVFPAVPMRRGGIRFTVTNHLSEADIDAMVRHLAMHYRAALAEEGLTFADVSRTFKIPAFEVMASPLSVAAERSTKASSDLVSEHLRTIEHIDPAEWDACVADRGNFTHAALRTAESIFAGEHAEADRWQFHYFTVRDGADRIVLSTVYTCARIKDDMFEPAAVSAQVELLRADDHDHLTSRIVMLGTLVTKGQHLFLDRTHADWKQALGLLLEQMQRSLSQVDASQIMMRDFMGQEDPELKGVMLELGLASIRLPDNHVIEDLGWADHEAYLQRLGARYRSDLRREVLRHAERFEVRAGPLNAAELKHAYSLYEQVFARSLELNVHKLPLELFASMAQDPAYDVIQLFASDDPRPEPKAVAVMFSHFEGRTYHAMFVGLDYAFVDSHNVYKQVLYQTTMRARALDATRLDLAFTAKLAKRKIGAHPQPTFAYVQIMDHFNVTVIDALPKLVRSA